MKIMKFTLFSKNAQTGKDISSIGLDEKEDLYQKNSEFLVNSIRKSSNLVEITLKEFSNE
ncbi:hypothetical protein K8P03_06995 [Anaerococcus murdochii]|uniref:Uncharacterized protein n=1 Tax=Anaerococcus murdochii TaxID=411577 RepID=A0ABS7SZR4_9FIRM|nr:hypothetical protein [Anaerococcus murdochii]MBZ2387027.1 hypothetical protein [Anaerococcus murdochii]